MKPDERHERMPRAEGETLSEVLRAVELELVRQARGGEADRVAAQELLRRWRAVR